MAVKVETMSTDFFKISKGVTLSPQPTEPSNPTNGDIYYDNSLNKFRKYENGAWTDLGSGSGGAGRNYFSDPDASIIGKFVRYADAAAPTPVDGVGGSPASTTSLNTSTPIIGLSSYRFSKASGNRQGEGWSITTDIPLDAPVKAGEPITVQFRYRTSANYAAGDMKMFVYLVGPNTVQALTGIRNDGAFTNDLGATGGEIGQFTGTCNADATTTAIRVIGHIATNTNTTTWDIDVDEITIGTSVTLTAPIVTDWVPFTGNVVGTTSGTLNIGTGGGAVSLFEWRRVGQQMQIRYRLRIGTSGATDVSGSYIFPLPNLGLTYVGGNYIAVGTGDITVLATANPAAILIGKIFTTGVVFSLPSGTLLNGGTGSLLFNNGNELNFIGQIQVQQWANSTNIISSTQAQFQSGAFKAVRSGV